jgi:hypothetical protein
VNEDLKRGPNELPVSPRDNPAPNPFIVRRKCQHSPVLCKRVRYRGEPYCWQHLPGTRKRELSREKRGDEEDDA